MKLTTRSANFTFSCSMYDFGESQMIKLQTKGR